MKLQINGETCHLIPIREFRIRNLLSPEFGINAFLPKDYTDLGRIDEAKTELQWVHAAVVASVPNDPPPSWMGMTLELQEVFHTQLIVINQKVGLRRSEIEYAVLGFGEVVQSFVNGLINAWMCRQPIPSFEEVYSDWLNRTTQLSQRVFDYAHQGKNWEIRLIKHAYGVMGLAIDTGENIYYIRDAERQCPAEGFMFNLIKEVTAKITIIANKAALEIVHGS
jgi:hypothetical protein